MMKIIIKYGYLLFLFSLLSFSFADSVDCPNEHLVANFESSFKESVNPPCDLAMMQRFLDDLDDVDFYNYLDALSDIEFDRATKAWRYLDGKYKRIHVASLQKVSELLDDPSFLSKLDIDGGNATVGEAIFENICKNAVNPLPPATSYLVPLAVHLENVKIVTNKFSGKPGFSDILADLAIPNNFLKQDGISHAINHMKNLEPNDVISFDYRFGPGDAADVTCTNCRFDVHLAGGKYIEYKSYIASSFQNLSYNQFLSYMESIENLSDLQYIFNKLKISETAVKDGMKTFIINKSSQLLSDLGPTKFNELFTVTNVSELNGLLNTTEGYELILDFVKVY